MLINEVETLLNLSKKSIRYYESEGLIKPERNKYNDYRTYTKNDIETLKKIKLLRELDVSIEEIKKLFKGTITLKECLNSRISKIETYEKNLKGIKNIWSIIIWYNFFTYIYNIHSINIILPIHRKR